MVEIGGCNTCCDTHSFLTFLSPRPVRDLTDGGAIFVQHSTQLTVAELPQSLSEGHTNTYIVSNIIDNVYVSDYGRTEHVRPSQQCI